MHPCAFYWGCICMCLVTGRCVTALQRISCKLTEWFEVPEYILQLVSHGLCQCRCIAAVRTLFSHHLCPNGRQMELRSVRRPGRKTEQWTFVSCGCLNFICMLCCGFKCVCLFTVPFCCNKLGARCKDFWPQHSSHRLFWRHFWCHRLTHNSPKANKSPWKQVAKINDFIYFTHKLYIHTVHEFKPLRLRCILVKTIKHFLALASPV